MDTVNEDAMSREVGRLTNGKRLDPERVEVTPLGIDLRTARLIGDGLGRDFGGDDLHDAVRFLLTWLWSSPQPPLG